MQAKTLFSRHFLDNRLANQPEWSEDALPALDQMRQLWQKAQQLGNTWNEAQTEEELIKPILKLLGWSYIVQPKNRRGGQVTRPDYALFADEASKASAQPYQGQDEAFYGRALAIAEAKHWGRLLSQQDRSDRATWKAESNPSHQMVSYLVGTRTPWGILTNGQTWRLYSREVSSTASEFYEIDLGAVFDFLPPGSEPSAAQMDLFRRWWLFFRRAAFTPDAQGKSFVQRVHEGSATYARKISERLKELVFEEVMPEIAGGFVAYRRQQMGIQEETAESRLEIYRASLSLLYKMLFLLYAEARSLLPMDNPDYHANSLTALAQWAAGQMDAQRKQSEATYATPKYDSLLALFRRVDRGDPSLGIPHYNGGLFNPDLPENRFLERHKLSDLAVARAIDRLVRHEGDPVDYAYISVRNLGAIYEGLLENKLVVSPLPAGEGPGVRAELVNDKGERKATGSYYTPDYIVEYIVEHTIDPILENRQADYEEAMGRITGLHKKLKNTANPATNRLLQGELGEAERQAREAFLGIKVLDPAMGSGHFLVNAVDHLTDGIILRMQAYHDVHPEARWEWDPIQQLIERVRAEIIKEMADQGLSMDARRLDDTALLIRLVMKRCIYGVDLNRMAVELAKVSLWLHSFTVGAPLSFLDHHLRWGNSLIGTDVRTVEYNITVKKQEQKISAQAKGLAKARGETVRETALGFQSSLFGGPFAGLLDLTAVMIEVAERADATLADVRESAQAYEMLQKELKPYKQALDLWVSQYFGNPGAKDFMELYGDDVLPALRGERPVTENYRQTVAKARQLYDEKRFFHWDLEFPEVFVDLRRRNWAENGGFDAVIGNPPYVRQEGLGDDKIFLENCFDTFQSTADLYVYFVEQSYRLLGKDNYCGVILSNKFTRASYGLPLRQFLTSKSKLLSFIDFGELPVFKSAATFPAIIVLQKSRDVSNQWLQVTKIRSLDFVNLDDEVKKLSYIVDNQGLISSSWSLAPKKITDVLSKASQNCIPLGELLEGRIYFGLKTGLNDVFYIHKTLADEILLQESQSTILLKTLLVGDDIRHYSIESRERCVIAIPSGWTHAKSASEYEKRAWEWLMLHHPALSNYLAKFEAGARMRSDHGEFWWELRPCNYYDVFEGEKIIYPDIAMTARFALDTEGYYVDATAFVIPNNSKYLLAILNSRLLFRYIQETAAVLGDVDASGRMRFKTIYVRNLPIHRIVFTTPDSLRRSSTTSLLESVFDYKSNVDINLQKIKKHIVVGQLDVIHDLLGCLAEQMITLNKTRQSEIKGFLVWLAREIGAPLDDLTGKTTIQNYLGDYQKGEDPATLEQILAVLRKNQKKLGVNVSGRAFQERLAQEYQASLGKLLPIKQKLAATDRLIDQIVYALYGLTDEEIAVVEGKV